MNLFYLCFIKVWQKLANQRNEMADCYRVLISQETKSENVILRDINRTFPAHKFFKESGGSGQVNNNN